jgi:hypothetical protein
MPQWVKTKYESVFSVAANLQVLSQPPGHKEDRVFGGLDDEPHRRILELDPGDRRAVKQAWVMRWRFEQESCLPLVKSLI